MWRQECHRHLLGAARPALEPAHDLDHWVIVTQRLAQLGEAYTRLAHARLTRHAVVIAVVNIGKLGGAVGSAFHARTLPPVACGLLLYNSYSVNGRRLLDKTGLNNTRLNPFA
jgi:hypothetical protein